MSVFDESSLGLFYFVFVLGFSAVLLTASYLYWKKKLGGAAGGQTPNCGFHPQRISLRGQHGDVLRTTARVDGPQGLMFTTFVEEPWLLVIPASGIMPQDVEIVAYTKHAPQQKRQSITVRLLPVDGESSFSQLDVEVRLKKGHPRRVGSPA